MGVYLANLNFGTSTIDPFSQIVSPEFTGLSLGAIAARYFYTYANLEICRRLRFAMQSRCSRGKLFVDELVFN